MKPILTLPCKNKHSDMEKREEGFHCKNCDHVLTDFRNSSEEEIHSALHKNQGKTCGIFNSNQFDYKVSQIQVPAFRAVRLSLLGILGFLGPVVTSCETDSAVEHKQSAFNLLKFPMHVKGSVKDEKTGKPLPFFKVEILQHGKLVKTVKTDAHGNFDILIQKSDLTQEVFKLAIGGSHYKNDTLTSNILKFSDNPKVRLTIKAEPTMVLEVEGEMACKTISGTEEHVMQVDGYIMAPEPVEESVVTAGIPEYYHEEAPKKWEQIPPAADTLTYPTLVSQYKQGKTKKIKEKIERKSGK